jgi:hypothetical protein
MKSYGYFRIFNNGRLSKNPITIGRTPEEASDKFNDGEMWRNYRDTARFVVLEIKD